MPAKEDSSEHKRITPVVEEVVTESVTETPDTENLEKEKSKPQEKGKEEKETQRSLDQEKEQKLNDILHGETKKSGNFKIIFITAFITALVIGLLAGGLYVYFEGIDTIGTGEPEPTPVQVQPSPTTNPTPSPTPESVDLTGFSVQALNGSGTAGAASTMADRLGELGFEDIDAGNAGRYDYENTIIQTKSDVPESVVSEIQKGLESEYSLKIGDELPSTSDYDIVITVGQ